MPVLAAGDGQLLLLTFVTERLRLPIRHTRDVDRRQLYRSFGHSKTLR